MNRNVVITGATSGIGREFAELFAKSGDSLLLTARSEDKLKDICQELKERFPKAQFEYIACDLCKSEEIARFSALLKEKRVDVLVNNAGFGITGAFCENDSDELNEMMMLNMNCLVQLSHAVIPQMMARGKGGIINVASLAAFMPNPYGNVYAATKAFVRSFSLALSEEVKDSGITVTALCPGPTETGFGSRSGMGESRIFKSGVMNAKTVAKAGFCAFENKRRSIVPGFRNKTLALAGVLAPACIALPIAAVMLKKK